MAIDPHRPASTILLVKTGRRLNVVHGGGDIDRRNVLITERQS